MADALSNVSVLIESNYTAADGSVQNYPAAVNNTNCTGQYIAWDGNSTLLLAADCAFKEQLKFLNSAFTDAPEWWAVQIADTVATYYETNITSNNTLQITVPVNAFATDPVSCCVVKR